MIISSGVRCEANPQIVVVEDDILRLEQNVAEDLRLITISCLDAAIADCTAR